MKCKAIIIRVCYKEFINYSYIIYTDDGIGVLVDPAWESEKILIAADKLQLDIKAVLITHGHSDHIHLAEFMSVYYNVPILISPEAKQIAGISDKSIIYVRDETPLLIDKLRIEPFLTPGHTKGCISYLINGNLFTGDCLFIEGCGTCTDSNSSPHDLFATMRRLVDIIPLSTKIYPGHKYHAELGQEFSYVLKNNIYLNITNEADFIKFRMRSGQKGFMNFI
ncbi:MBL fold metallo-hydrolase [Paenibacillus sp. sgz5001063]|uniref:MBL fold metallo-hydrolase n=1 Tax=Paenibacillus sp. sgz5001063 TaxID=3242474 RepID=UPI0036D289A3